MGTLKATNLTIEGKNLIFTGDNNGITGLPTASGTTVNLVAGKDGSVQVGTLTGDAATGYTLTETKHQSGKMDKTTVFRLVRNKTELQNIKDNLSGSYLLAGNIDASGDFTPIGNVSTSLEIPDTPFTGQFNGMNYEIGNLKIEKPEDNGVGLFGLVGQGGTVKNVGVTNGTIEGSSYVGGIAGDNWGIITNVYYTGTVKGWNFIGGIVGYNRDVNITNAYNEGTVEGTKNIGGVVGYNGGNITNVYNVGPVKGGTESIGGIVGYNPPNCTITNAYNTGNVSSADGVSSVGGIVGHSEGNIIDAYTTTGDDNQGDMKVADVAALKTALASAAPGVWDTSGDGLPTLKAFAEPAQPSTWGPYAVIALPESGGGDDTGGNGGGGNGGGSTTPATPTNPTPTTPVTPTNPTPSDPAPTTQTTQTSDLTDTPASNTPTISDVIPSARGTAAGSMPLSTLTEAENIAATIAADANALRTPENLTDAGHMGTASTEAAHTDSLPDAAGLPDIAVNGTEGTPQQYTWTEDGLLAIASNPIRMPESALQGHSEQGSGNDAAPAATDATVLALGEKISGLQNSVTASEDNPASSDSMASTDSDTDEDEDEEKA